MADDYYEPNSPDAATAQAQQEEDQNDQPDNTDQTEGDEPTALVDKAFCPDMKVGQKFTGEVVGVHEDEYEIKYLSPEEDDSAKSESTMSKSESALDKMAVAPEAA